jgi:hypothetical protein
MQLGGDKPLALAKPRHALGYSTGIPGRQPGNRPRDNARKLPQSPLMITETNFLAETFYAHSMIYFRQEKSFQDHSWAAAR